MMGEAALSSSGDVPEVKLASAGPMVHAPDSVRERMWWTSSAVAMRWVVARGRPVSSLSCASGFSPRATARTIATERSSTLMPESSLYCLT